MKLEDIPTNSQRSKNKDPLIVFEDRDSAEDSPPLVMSRGKTFLGIFKWDDEITLDRFAFRGRIWCRLFSSLFIRRGFWVSKIHDSQELQLMLNGITNQFTVDYKDYATQKQILIRVPKEFEPQVTNMLLKLLPNHVVFGTKPLK